MITRLTFLLTVMIAIAFSTVAPLSVNAEEDERTMLVLNSAEKSAVRSEMRRLLETVSHILFALSKKDMAGVEATARPSGMAMAGQVEVSLKEKLTLPFMKLGKSVHFGFDQIADAARDGASQEKVTGLIAEQVNRCTTCHSAFGLR